MCSGVVPNFLYPLVVSQGNLLEILFIRAKPVFNFRQRTQVGWPKNQKVCLLACPGTLAITDKRMGVCFRVYGL